MVHKIEGSSEQQISMLKREIGRRKLKLIAEAKSRGLTENFGQKDVRELRDMIGGDYGELGKLVDDFDNWAMNVDQRTIKSWKA